MPTRCGGGQDFMSEAQSVSDSMVYLNDGDRVLMDLLLHQLHMADNSKNRVRVGLQIDLR